MAAPGCAAWTPAEAPLRLGEVAVPKGEPKALACYGLLVRGLPAAPAAAGPGDECWLRFVDGRPVSAITTQFLAWGAAQAAARGLSALVWVWDDASWHPSREVRGALRTHNQAAHRTGGVRIVPCWLRRVGCRSRAPGSPRSSPRGRTASGGWSNRPAA